MERERENTREEREREREREEEREEEREKNIFYSTRCLVRRPTIKAFTRPLSCCRSPGYN